MEEPVEICKQLVAGLIERMGIEAEVEGSIKEDVLSIEVKGDREGVLIGKHGRTLDALQLLVGRMLTKRVGQPLRVVLDIDHYRERRAGSLTKMARRIGGRVKRLGKPITIGPLNAHDRRIIHMALREDPDVRTESLGEGAVKRVAIIPQEK